MPTIDVEELQGILKKLEGTLGSKSIMEVYSAICFRDGKAYTFDGVTGAVVRTPFGTEIECCTPGDGLIDLVSKLKAEVTLEIKKDILHVQCGGLKAKLPTFSYADFPDFIPTDRSEILADDILLIPACSAVLPFAGKDFNALGGVAIVGDKVYSCTGQTVTRANLSKSISHMVHVPDRFIKALVTMGPPTCLFRARDLVGAFWEEQGQVLVTNQIVARFPHEQVDTVFEVSGHEDSFPEELDDVCKRIAPSLTDYAWVTVTQASGQLTVASRSSYETIPWTGVPDFSFKVHLKRFQQALKFSSKVRLGSVISGENRGLVFVGDQVLHALALGE